MTTAPQRPTQAEPAQTIDTKPNLKTHGHLALLEWDDATLRFAPAPNAVPVHAQPFGPKKRTLADRCYDGGTLALLAVTVAALAAALCRF